MPYAPPLFIEWSPLFLGAGIGLYFLQSKPCELWALLFCALLFLVTLILKRFFWAKGLAVMLFGFLLVDAHLKLRQKSFRLFRPIFKAQISGTVQEIAFRSDRQTILLGPPHMTISWKGKRKKPWTFTIHHQRVKLSLPGSYAKSLAIGSTLRGVFYILPPQGRMTLYGFDFKRHAYFTNILGTGFPLKPPEVIPPQINPSFFQPLRTTIAKYIKQTLKGQEAAIAAALITGDTSALHPKTRESFSQAGIAHVLAISGLHLTLIAGVLFFLIRRILCLFPCIALPYNTKKLAGIFVLLGSAFYLGLSNASVSTQRAFMMLCLVLIALWLDRPPFSRRFVMIAALVVLCLQPAAIFMPSFHLSFLAVLGLIQTHQILKQRFEPLFYRKGVFARLLLYLKGICLSSLTASLATLPFTIYHFHQFTLQSLTSNLMAIPLMSFWIMPSALMSVLLMPFQGHAFFLSLMAMGIQWMQRIAEKIAAWPGAAFYVPELPPYSLCLFLVGTFLFLMLEHKKRLWGLALLILAFNPLFFLDQPLLFVSEGNKVAGLYQNKILWVTARRPPTFLTGAWSASLGQNPNILMPWPKHGGMFRIFDTPCGRVGYAQHKEHVQALCNRVDILIARTYAPCENSLMITPRTTWRQGTLFLYCKEGAPIFKHAKSMESQWPWERLR